jgi:cyclase
MATYRPPCHYVCVKAEKRVRPANLATLVMVVTACTTGQPSLAASKVDTPFAYDVITVAPNVYAFVENELRGIVSGTVVAVVGDDSVLIFDTTHRVSSAKSIIVDLKRLTKKPVRYVINSHWHEDHWTGNGEFAAAFPNATFYAHPFTAQIIHKRRESFRGEHCKEELRAELGPLQKEIAFGKRDDGTAIAAAGMKFRAQMAAELAAQIAECDRMRYRGVDVTFESEMSFALGGRTVQVKHLGRGNTAGDVIAYLPGGKILITGDLVVAPFPFATQSYIREWADVLDKLIAMDADIIIPGHGKIMRDNSYLQDLSALLRSITTQVHAVYKPGMTVDEVRAKVNIKSFRDKFAGDDPFIGVNFDYMLMQSAVDRAVQEEQGAFKPEG